MTTRAAGGEGGGSRAGLVRVGAVLVSASAIAGSLECAPVREPTVWASVHAEAPDAPAILPEPPSTKSRWEWPGGSAFRARETAVTRDAQPIRLVWGRAGGVDDVALAIAPEKDGTYALWVEFTLDHDDRYKVDVGGAAGWTLDAGALRLTGGEVALTFSKHGKHLDVHGALSPIEPPTKRAITDWTYVATLLGDEPLYDEGGAGGPDPAAEIEAARAAGDEARALGLYRAYRPMGACSMDTRPAEVARGYADLCYRMGKLGCFLQLQINIMGDQFERAATSSYGEAAHGTEAARLLDTGLDLPRFFRGLALRFAGVSRRGELGPFRLARSVKEAGLEATLVPVLEDMATAPWLDAYNRLRATTILSFVGEARALDPASLDEVGRAWLEARRRAKN